MHVLLVEDEALAAERVRVLLKQIDPSITIVNCVDSIEDAVKFLKTNPAPDLILLDIQLSDGHSFEIFERIDYKGPVIFITAYDQYAINAFRLFSIDYILKPVSKEALAIALLKFQNIKSNFQPLDYKSIAGSLRPENNFKRRFLCRVGQRLFFVEVGDIAFFQADNKVVYLVDKEGNKYLVDYTLERLEQLLDPQEFFRLNRKFIVKISSIEQIKPYFNNRLKLVMKGSASNDDLVISRERVPEFRVWAEA